MTELAFIPQIVVALRDDLIVSHQHTMDPAIVVVKGPLTERFFHFREIEGFILQQRERRLALSGKIAAVVGDLCRRLYRGLRLGAGHANVARHRSFTTINYLALVVMATSGIKTRFNLHPSIKLDGYYLLSDYLEIPNLRRRAFGHLRDRVCRLWGAGCFWSTPS